MSTDLAIMLLAMVFVVTVQDVWLDVKVEGFLECLLVLDVQRDSVKVFVALANVWVLGL